MVCISFCSAHNGNEFDFPLLMKEIKLTGASLRQLDHLFCVDSLQGCRDLLPAGRLESYTLASVYEGLIGRMPPSSHQAEADCFNLLQITAEMDGVKEVMEMEWIPWAEENMVKFDTIHPMRF